MNWTTTPPTVPGYYWMRDPDMHALIVVRVDVPTSFDREYRVWYAGSECEDPIDPRAEWAGPLTPPGAA